MIDNYTTLVLNATLDGFGKPNNTFNFMIISTFYTGPYVRYTVVVRAATSVGKGDPYVMTFYTEEGGKYIFIILNTKVTVCCLRRTRPSIKSENNSFI